MTRSAIGLLRLCIRRAGVRRFIGSSFRTIARLVPKDPSLILFGARKGHWYMDNPRHVYEWILANRPDLRPVWMTASRTVEQELSQKGYPVCRTQSPRGLFLLGRASLAAISTQIYDVAAVAEAVPDSLRVLFLGHGKSVKAAGLAFKTGQSKQFRYALERAAELIVVAISTSEYVSELAAIDNGLPLSRFEITGYPLNDLLVEPTDEIGTSWISYLDGLEPARTVLYAPTWRKRGERTRFFPFEDFDAAALAEYLERHRTLVLLRPHERDVAWNKPLVSFLSEISTASEWLRVCGPDTVGNVNHVLPFVDVLITDYSSIYHDFLLLDRSMLFIPYDYDSFAEIQGFMYNYFSHLPGPVISTQKELLAELDSALRGDDSYREKRKSLRRMIHAHADARSRERVVAIIDRLLVDTSRTGLG